MGGDIPIRIELIEDATNPDFTINVVNREGRGDAATICAREGGLRGFAIHEGGHQMLGVGDEYPELDAAVCKRVPQWCRAERVRDKDWSRMGSHGDYGRFALFHERHFQFVPAFLNAAYPDCKAQLVELRRPLLPDFRVGFSFGVASLGGGSSYLMSAGLSFGIPASRLRDVEAVIGVQATSMLGSLPDLREALLLGVRVGIERRSTPSAGGFTGSAFLESGVGRFSASDPKTYERQKSSAPYAQIGLGFGYTFSPNPLFQPYVGVEATAGTAFSTKGTIGEAEAGGRDDESWRHWFGLGVSLGARF
jgi:hypothetical protein